MMKPDDDDEDDEHHGRGNRSALDIATRIALQNQQQLQQAQQQQAMDDPWHQSTSSHDYLVPLKGFDDDEYDEHDDNNSNNGGDDDPGDFADGTTSSATPRKRRTPLLRLSSSRLASHDRRERFQSRRKLDQRGEGKQHRKRTPRRAARKGQVVARRSSGASFASSLSLGSALGSIGSAIEDMIGIGVGGSGGKRKKGDDMTLTNEVSEAERGALLLPDGDNGNDDSDGVNYLNTDDVIDNDHVRRGDRARRRSVSFDGSDGLSLLLSDSDYVHDGTTDDDDNAAADASYHSLGSLGDVEVVVDRRRRDVTRRRSDQSLLTDDGAAAAAFEAEVASVRRGIAGAGAGAGEGDDDANGRMDRLERLIARVDRLEYDYSDYLAGGEDGNNGTAGEGYDDINEGDDLTIPLSVGSRRSRGARNIVVAATAVSRFRCRYAILLIAMTALVAIAFTMGFYEGGLGSGNTAIPGSYHHDADPPPKVSHALEKVLQRLKAEEAASSNNQGQYEDDYDGGNGEAPVSFFGTGQDMNVAGQDMNVEVRPPKKKAVEVLLECTHEDGCLEAMRLARSVKVEEIKTSSMVAIDIEVGNFERLRALKTVRQIDLDYKTRSIEDDLVDDNIDLEDVRDFTRANAGGNLRSRRDAQSVPRGFEMIQAVGDDGRPFEPGPYRRKICIADTGTCRRHPDISPRYPVELDGADASLYDGTLHLPWDEDRNGHGCHLNGLIQSVYNDIGEFGVGGSDVFVTRALKDDKNGSIGIMIAAINQCVSSGASIIVLSLGCTGCEGAMPASFFKRLTERGIMVFAAAGNNGDDPSSGVMLPAGFANTVISVGAVNIDSTRFFKSAANDQVEFCAHGSSVVSTGFNLIDEDTYAYDYVRKSGTSMSCPQVAATAGLLWSHFPRCNGQQIRSVLAKTAVPVKGTTGCTNACGHGIVQLASAYNLLKNSRDGDDYDCDVAGPILSSTNRVCDCVNSNFNPSSCIVPTPPQTQIEDVQDQIQRPTGKGLDEENQQEAVTEPACSDDDAASFRVKKQAKRGRKLVLIGQGNQRKKRRRRKQNQEKVVNCSFLREKRKRAARFCKVSADARQICPETCGTCQQ